VVGQLGDARRGGGPRICLEVRVVAARPPRRRGPAGRGRPVGRGRPRAQVLAAWRRRRPAAGRRPCACRRWPSRRRPWRPARAGRPAPGAGHQLVDEARRGRPRAGHHARADAVAVGGGVGELLDPVLVEVAAEHDPGVGGAGLVEHPPGPAGLRGEVAGVDAHAAEVAAAGRERPARGPRRCRRCRPAGWWTRRAPSTWASKAPVSSSCRSVNECAEVPSVGTPCRRPASRFEVPAKPTR
jgi:hypothetical protein